MHFKGLENLSNDDKISLGLQCFPQAVQNSSNDDKDIACTLKLSPCTSISPNNQSTPLLQKEIHPDMVKSSRQNGNNLVMYANIPSNHITI